MTDSPQEHDELFKFIIIGEADTGKSSLLRYFLDKKFRKSPQTNHTVGVEFGAKTVTLYGKRVKLQIWDTAGQERFRSVTRSYYRGSMGCLLVYDITNRETFNRLPCWLADARELAKDVTVIVVGNKIDKKEERDVTLLEASGFAQDNGLLFLETSALTGECVDEVFLKCANSILSKIQQGQLSTTAPDDPSTQTDKIVREERYLYCQC